MLILASILWGNRSNHSLQVVKQRKGVKVFFNHIAKCGGTTINSLAHKTYGDHFHVLSASTEESELRRILEKEHFFITSELNSVSLNSVQAILTDKSITRIVLTRDPIERFQSFFSHSTRDNPKEGETAFWKNELLTHSITTANGWLTACLSRAEQMIAAESNHTFCDQNLIFSVYSQWLLCSFAHYFDLITGEAEPIGGGNSRVHIKRYRDNAATISLEEQMGRILSSFYTVVGVTEKMGDFVENLISHNILTRETAAEELPRLNASHGTINPALTEIKEELAAKYYGMLPEDFIVHFLCSKFSDEIKCHTNNKLCKA